MSPSVLPRHSEVDADAGRAPASLTRMLSILDLFTLESPVVQIEQVTQRLSVGQSTAYRYLKELSSAGLITGCGKGRFVLGRRIVEFERMLQLSDPLLLGGRPVMQSLAPLCENRVFLLCAPHKSRVLCVDKVGGDAILTTTGSKPILRGRGTTFPLFWGAGSQAILAHLPAHQIKSLYLSHAEEMAAAGLGEDWKALLRSLGTIRKQGYAMTVGRTHEGVYSLAVPVVRDGIRVAGSLLMLGDASASALERDLALVPMLQAKADEIAASLPSDRS